MKLPLYLLLAATCLMPSLTLAREFSEDDVLHAAFAAFQEPGVFSGDYIARQRRLLELAAQEGDKLARLVVNKTPSEGRESADGGYVSLVR